MRPTEERVQDNRLQYASKNRNPKCYFHLRANASILKRELRKGGLVIQWHELEDHPVEHRQSCDVQWTELRIVPNYYQQLGIDPTATETEIKRAYRKLATLFHPDHQSGSFRATAETRMREINAAYGVLRCSQRRAIYDAQLAQ